MTPDATQIAQSLSPAQREAMLDAGDREAFWRQMEWIEAENIASRAKDRP